VSGTKSFVRAKNKGRFSMGLFGPPNIEKMKAKGDVNGLIKALAHQTNSHVRCDAAKALGELKDTRAVEPLLLMLKDENYDVRESAVRALGSIGDVRVIEPLVTIAELPMLRGNKQYEKVREAASEALGSITDARSVEPLIAAFKNHRWLNEIGNSLAKIGPSAVAPLIASLTDTEFSGHAAEILGWIGDERAVEPLIALLTDEKLCTKAAGALGKIGDVRAVEPLIAVLKSTVTNRENVAKSMDITGEKETTKSVLGNLHRNATEIINSLEKIGDTRAVEPLIALLKDEDFAGYAANALGMMGDPRAVEPLIAALEDEDWVLRKNAVAALGNLKDSRSVEPLIAALGFENNIVRMHAAIALGNFKDTRALEALIDALKNNRKYAPEVANAAAESLGKIGDARAVEPLTHELIFCDSKYKQPAKALVSLYRSGNLSETDKKHILDCRSEITASHVDHHEDCSGGEIHTDHGAEVEFPL
jgi:HEAT repeat protein